MCKSRSEREIVSLTWRARLSDNLLSLSDYKTFNPPPLAGLHVSFFLSLAYSSAGEQFRLIGRSIGGKRPSPCFPVLTCGKLYIWILNIRRSVTVNRTRTVFSSYYGKFLYYNFNILNFEYRFVSAWKNQWCHFVPLSCFILGTLSFLQRVLFELLFGKDV